MAVAEIRVLLQARLGARLEGHALRAVDLGGHLGDLLLEGQLAPVEGLHLRDIGTIGRGDDLAGEIGHAFPALQIALGQRRFHANRRAVVEHGLQVGVGVVGETVQRHHRLGAPAADVRGVARQVREALVDRAVGRSALRAQGLQRHDHHGHRRHVTAHGHDDVEELLGAEVGGEAGLVHDVVGQVQAEPLCQHAARAVRDVGERPAVHDGRRALARLHQVRHERVVQQHHHRADSLQIRGGDGFAVVVQPDDDAAEAGPQIGAALGQRHDGHDLGRRRDDEAGFPRRAVLTPAHSGRDAAQRAVVHVHAARPQQFLRIEPQLVAEMQVRVDERGQQVVRRGDGVEVAVEVQVDLVDRMQRRLAAAGGAALLPEHRPERRLAQRRHGMLADVHQALGEADGVHGLALAAGRRRDGRHQHQAAAARREPVERLEPDLGRIAAVGLEQVIRQTETASDVSDGFHKWAA